MWKSVIYKEWLKVKWIYIGLTILGLLVIGRIFLKVQHDMLFNGSSNLWYFVLFQGYAYYGDVLKFIPLIIGLGIGVAQYVPEILSKRIKLTFHLPLNENKALFMMLSFGFLCLLLSYALMYGSFIGLSHHFFASEIVKTANISIISWFLAGFSAYFLVALVIMEPIMKYRLFYLIVTYFFIIIFMESQVPGGFEPINWKLTILTLMTSVSLLFSAYRFRKGEM